MKELLSNNIEIALKLKREKNLTFKEIAIEMNKPLGTIKRWLAPYKFRNTVEYKDAVKKGGLKGSLKMQENYALKKHLVYNKTVETVVEDLKNFSLRDFINIYIGEGTKRTKNVICVTNTDLCTILLSIKVMKKFFLKDGKKIIFEIKYYKENDNANELLNYWENLLKKDDKIVFRTYLQPTQNPHDHNNSNKFGLISLRINDSYAREKLNAYIDYLKKEWLEDFEEEFITKIDHSIKEVKSIFK